MNKKTFFLTFATILSVMLLAYSLSGGNVAKASSTYIFSDGFESGTLSNWNSLAGYGAFSINSQLANSGIYSVESVDNGGSNGNLMYHVLSSVTNPIDFREYVYLTSATFPSTKGDYYEVGGFADSTAANNGDGEICVFNVAGTLYWGIYYRDLSSKNGFSFLISDTNSTSTANKVSTGSWNSLELQQTTGTNGPPNGQEQLFLNGVSIVNATTNNSDRTPYSAIIGGSQSVAKSSDSWNFYIDDVAVSSSYIGFAQYQLTMFTNYGTVSPGNGTNPEGSPITITATPPATAPGTQYLWNGWTGTGVGSYTGTGTATGTGSYTAPITMSSPITETASWTLQYRLTVNSPYGTAGTIGGTNGWFDAGTTAYAAITPTTVAGTTGTQYVFTSWSGAATGTGSTSNAIVMNGPETATANWQTQYNITIAESGVGSDFSGTVMTVNGTSYGFAGFTAWANANDVYTFNYVSSPLVATPDGEQYLLTGISGNSSALAVTVSQPIAITGTYKTQYYLIVTSTHDSPSPASGWFDKSTSITDYVASPSAGYICTGWIGTGSVASSGSTSVVTFAITAPSSITWNWQPQSTSSSTPTPTPTKTSTPTNSPTPKPTITPTASPKTSPSVPEFSSATAVLIAAALTIVAFATIALTKKAKK